MKNLRALLVRLGGVFVRGRREREMTDEIASHLQAHVDDNVNAGMTPEQRLRALPDVRAAGGANALPLLGESYTTQVHLESDTQYRIVERPVAAYRNVTPGFFATMEIPLLAGRLLEQKEPMPSAVISVRLAGALWPGENLTQVPGRRVRLGDFTSAPLSVVGVVGDVRTGALDREPMSVIYRPHSQAPSRDLTIAVRTANEPEALAAAIRTTAWGLNKDLPIPAVRTMREIVSSSMAQRRFQMVLMAMLGGVALALAVVGIYGVTSQTVASRTREIGIRMALGALRADVLRTVLRQGLQPVLAGLIVGLAGGRLATLAIRSALFGVEPLDPLAIGGVVFTLLGASVLACLLPARHASSVDPAIVLRLDQS
jgi:putative ABC transport system permease protein